MSIISWNDSFSVGIKKIDMQHKRLIDMINDLHDAMKSGKGNEKMGSILNDMISYTVTHFNTEEQLFKKYGYAQTDDHIAQHKSFVDQAKKIKSDFDAGKPVFSLKLMNFLKDWLKNHILKTDMLYKDFLTSKGEN